MQEDLDWEMLPKRERRKRRRELAREEKKRQAGRSSLWKWAGGFLGVIILGLGGFLWWRGREVLPPTDIAGHIEQSPQSHILDKPMPLSIQKHMLEHADGSGPPGVVINYNCDDFKCPGGTIEDLHALVQEYPEFVYLAPFPGMTKMLAITRVGKIQTFDTFEKDALIRFIEER